MGLRGVIVDLGFGDLIDEGLLASQQALSQISINFVMALVGKTKGAISNKEMDIFFQASPTLGSTYDGYMMMLDYMDRIAELSERYNAEWQAKAVELQDASVSEVNAALAKFKTEFKSKPENKLIQTEQERQYLESIADKETYRKVNRKFLDIESKARAESEKVSNVNQRASNLIKEIENDESLSPVEKAQKIKEIQDILG